MLEEQRGELAVRVEDRSRQRRKAERAPHLGIGAALEQEARSFEPPIRASDVQQCLTTVIARIHGHAAVENSAETRSVAGERAEERGTGVRD